MSEKERMLKQGHSERYAEGYQDGCSTGQGEAGMFVGFTKNPKLSKISKEYRRGWGDGREFCKNQSLSNQRSITDDAIRARAYKY